jgi:hypothetical protein
VLIGAAVQAGVIQSFERVIYLVKGNLFSAVFPFSQTITFSVQASLLYGVLNIKSSPGSHHADFERCIGYKWQVLRKKTGRLAAHKQIACAQRK